MEQGGNWELLMKGSPDKELQLRKNGELLELAPDFFLLERGQAELDGRMEKKKCHSISRTDFKVITSGCLPVLNSEDVLIDQESRDIRREEERVEARDSRIRIDSYEGNITHFPAELLL
ncbi:hypothetical protein PIB30_005643 [Stylosanthes scabra]|uniref:Uncharacterized protein n=1 Tax=Stylosanthes scabra TaxID=79078 RepID=A0ABU6T3T7_9FABA|nr:hypothetical protein [Stylosanthes scabra]